MTSDLSLEELWDGWAPYTAVPFCPFAQEFEKWADELCSTTEKARTLAAVNVAKVLLTDKYFEWRTFVPRKHRAISSTSGGHTCIWHVFETTYRRIKIMELTISLPPFAPLQQALPAPASPPAPPPIATGIYLGETED